MILKPRKQPTGPEELVPVLAQALPQANVSLVRGFLGQAQVRVKAPKNIWANVVPQTTKGFIMVNQQPTGPTYYIMVVVSVLAVTVPLFLGGMRGGLFIALAASLSTVVALLAFRAITKKDYAPLEAAIRQALTQHYGAL